MDANRKGGRLMAARTWPAGAQPANLLEYGDPLQPVPMTRRQEHLRHIPTARRHVSSALFAIVFASIAFVQPAFCEDPIRPDPHLTPGAVLTTDTSRICTPGYAKSVRHTSGELKHLVYREYGIDPREGHYEVDHLISLELGGADVRANLWPESYDTEPWNAHVKDRLENFLHREVCEGRIPIGQAQREIATDWIGAYERYLGEPR